MLGGPQSRSRCGGEEKFPALPGLEPPIIRHQEDTGLGSLHRWHERGNEEGGERKQEPGHFTELSW